MFKPLPLLVCLTLSGCLSPIDYAHADCAGDGVADKKRHFQTAQSLDREGKKTQALFSYEAAVGYTCENKNPYEMDAAKRAAALGLERRRGRFQSTL